jgi:hypothetical protein
MVIFFLALAQPDTVRHFIVEPQPASQLVRHDSRMPAHFISGRTIFHSAHCPNFLGPFFKDFKVEIEPLKVRFANGSTRSRFILRR